MHLLPKRYSITWQVTMENQMTASKNEITMPSVHPTECELTHKQLAQWDVVRAAFLWQCPAFAHVFYEMMTRGTNRAIFTKDVPIAATDGKSVMINPDTFFNYTVDENVFAVAHEIAHGIFNHIGVMYKCQQLGKVSYPDGTSLPYDHQTMNIAADLVINDMLIESKVGTFNKDWLHDTSYATFKDSVLDSYRKVFKQTQGGSKGKCNPGGNGPKGVSFDQHLAPGSSTGQDPGMAVQGRNDQQWKATVAAAMESARLQGRLPAAMDRFFREMLEPQVDWREHLASEVARQFGSSAYDWHRPNRRLIAREIDPIYAPGKSGFGTGVVVIGIDTSGSIGEKEIDMALGEVAGLLEDCKPKQLFLMWCDAKVHRVDECDEVGDLREIRAKGAPGGGGTSFIPVFDKIEEMNITPEALVYLTDGQGSFPAHSPLYPVIWGSFYEQSVYPFGVVINIPKQA